MVARNYSAGRPRVGTAWRGKHCLIDHERCAARSCKRQKYWGAIAMAVGKTRALRAILGTCVTVMLGAPDNGFASAFLNPNGSAGAASVSTAGQTASAED